MGWHSLIRTVNVCFLSVTSEKPTTYWRLSAALLGLIGNLRTVFCLLITGRLKTNNGQLMRGRKPLAVHCATRLSNKTKIYAWLMLWTCVLLLFGFVRKFEFFLFFFRKCQTDFSIKRRMAKMSKSQVDSRVGLSLKILFPFTTRNP